MEKQEASMVIGKTIRWCSENPRVNSARLSKFVKLVRRGKIKQYKFKTKQHAGDFEQVKVRDGCTVERWRKQVLNSCIYHNKYPSDADDILGRVLGEEDDPGG